MATKASSAASSAIDSATTDTINQILTNAQVIFPNEKDVKVITALSSSGSLHYSSLVASDPKSASAHKEYKSLIVGSGEKTREVAVVKLLDEVEKRVAKQVLKK